MTLKILRTVILSIFFLFCSLQYTQAQSSESVRLDSFSLDKKEDIVRISIKTTESFIVGANRYVLHIGGQYFLRNEHPDGHLDEIVFLVPLSDYENIQAQGEIVLVYGYYHENAQQDNEGSHFNGYVGKHWRLGTFNPQNFTE